VNPLIILVLLALAWYSFEVGMQFFAILLVLAAIMVIFTQREENQSEQMYVGAPGGHGGQSPVIMEPEHGKTWPQYRGSDLYDTQHIRLQIKPKWKKHWLGKPFHYLFFHAGVALGFVFRSVLYMFGIEKDRPGEE